MPRLFQRLKRTFSSPNLRREVAEEIAPPVPARPNARNQDLPEGSNGSVTVNLEQSVEGITNKEHWELLRKEAEHHVSLKRDLTKLTEDSREVPKNIIKIRERVQEAYKSDSATARSMKYALMQSIDSEKLLTEASKKGKANANVQLPKEEVMSSPTGRAIEQAFAATKETPNALIMSSAMHAAVYEKKEALKALGSGVDAKSRTLLNSFDFNQGGAPHPKLRQYISRKSDHGFDARSVDANPVNEYMRVKPEIDADREADKRNLAIETMVRDQVDRARSKRVGTSESGNQYWIKQAEASREGSPSASEKSVESKRLVLGK